MVSMDHKDGNGNGKVLVHVVGVGVLVSLKSNVLLAKDRFVKDLLALPEGLARGLVIMEEVPTHNHKVWARFRRYF